MQLELWQEQIECRGVRLKDREMNVSGRLEELSTEQNWKQTNNKRVKNRNSYGQSSRNNEAAEEWFSAEETLETARRPFLPGAGKDPKEVGKKKEGRKWAKSRPLMDRRAFIEYDWRRLVLKTSLMAGGWLDKGTFQKAGMSSCPAAGCL